MAGNNEIRFNRQLLDCIKHRINDEANLMLNNYLAKAYDNYGTLLHYAVKWSNEAIVQRLIELGAEVDRWNKDGETCLGLAIQNMEYEIIKLLLKANADIHKADRQGTSALQMVCNSNYRDNGVTILLLKRLQSESNDTEQFVDKLAAIGCNFSCASLLEDTNVIRCMLQRGFDINSKGYRGRTALHFAVKYNNTKLAKLLIELGADVNALDETERNPLLMAVYNRYKRMLKILLEAGADPNAKCSFPAIVLVFMDNDRFSMEDSDQCLQLLLQHGTIVKLHSQLFNMAFHINVNFSKTKKINILVNYLAMQEELGTPIPYSELDLHEQQWLLFISELADTCKKFLRNTIFGNVTMLELLTNRESEMRTRVRNNNLVSRLQQLLSNDEIERLFPYYHRTLAKRLSKARRAMELEDTAITVISKIMNGNTNLCHVVACKVIENLNDKDLNQLALV